MKFRYYITSLFEGNITGTNDIKIAEEYALSEECFVVDAETSEWIDSSLERLKIEELKKES